MFQSHYSIGRFFFWIAVSVVAGTLLFVLYNNFILPYEFYLYPATTENFFSSSLNLMLSIFSLVIIVVIFLIQNTTQEYSSRLSEIIFYDKYFLASVGFVLLASGFSITAHFFKLENFFALLGYSFSIATILLLGSMIGFTAYFINVQNIIEYVTTDIENNIKAKKIYKKNPFNLPIQDDDYIENLTTKTQLIVSTCIKAIEKNQKPVVDSCLRAFERITSRFLEETTNEDVNENYLIELNDQFQFISSATLQNNPQKKYSKAVVETIGDIGINITSSRILGNQGGLWVKLLVDLFQPSLSLNRRDTASAIIDKVGDTNIRAINKKHYQNALLFHENLKEIGSILTKNYNGNLATLLQNLFLQYQHVYVAYLDNFLTTGEVAEVNLRQLVDDFSVLFNDAKLESKFYGLQTICAGLFGLNSFALKIQAKLPGQKLDDARKLNQLKKLLESLVDFIDRISTNNIKENYGGLFKGYIQFLYLFERANSLGSTKKKELVTSINEAWIKLMRKSYREAFQREKKVENELNKYGSEFIGILIYFHKNEPEVIAELIDPYVDLYKEMKDISEPGDKYVEQNRKRLYKLLKIIGAWLNKINHLENGFSKLWNILVNDFSLDDSMTEHKIVPILQRYGYPVSSSYTNNLWWLQPDKLWQNTDFQDDIAQLLNGKEGRNYIRFHKKLKQASQNDYS